MTTPRLTGSSRGTGGRSAVVLSAIVGAIVIATAVVLGLAEHHQKIAILTPVGDLEQGPE